MYGSSLLKGYFQHRTQPRVSDTRISVRGGVLVDGILLTRGDSMAVRNGRIERTSPSRFLRTCRT